MIDEVMSYIQDIWGRLSKLESKNQQLISVYATTTASKNTNINNVAVTALNWNNSAEVNRGTLFAHSTVTNDTRVTFNRKCVVVMTATIVSSGAVTNASMRVRFRVNGSNLLRTSAWLHHVNAGGDIEDACTLVRAYSFAAGDYIEVCTDLQGAAGTITLNGSQSMLEIYEVFQ